MSAEVQGTRVVMAFRDETGTLVELNQDVGTYLPTQLPPTMVSGKVRHLVLTLGAAGVTTVVNIPSDVRGFRLKPSADIRINLGVAPLAPAPASGVAVAAGSFEIGNTVPATVWTERVLPDFETGQAASLRELHINSTTAAATVQIETF